MTSSLWSAGVKRLVEHPRVVAGALAWQRSLERAAPKAWSMTFKTRKLGDSLWKSGGELVTHAQAGLAQRGGASGALVALATGDLSARITWSRLKDRAQGAWRNGVMDAQAMEAYQIYSAHEHHINFYRAQGVLHLKMLERDAQRVLSQLPAHRRAQLEVVAQEIKASGLKSMEPTRGDANCGQCVRKLAPDQRGGDCCGGMVFLGWDEVDGLFRALLGEHAPVPLAFEGEPTRCGFLGKQGCLLPPGTRPTVCTAYYCQPYKDELQQQGRWAALSTALLELNDGRRSLNFRLKLARRFVLQEKTTANATHPLDFIWDRLRNNGAELGATGKRQNAPNRLQVVP